MKSLDDLKKLRDEALKKVEMREGGKEYRVVVGMATSGIAAGARPVLNQLVKDASDNNYNCVITQTGDIGLNSYEPIVQIFDKDNHQVTYVHVTPEKASRILKEHVGEGKVVEEYTVDAAEKANGKL
ncbi:MAG: (2Fe-2S) ferredoxin domain-containing protein [Solobacterium sp.]|jgi:NADP-reducing hydrogenase subunit HndB|nr:(2Fe-2S) ferredoxin domain-containing protein [Solobacterium sp.]MCH4205033.1 (2Fe-2S) ferredoxin domain-containing protein [Solobacterium sp.]MCH4226542.1 (2Fe-2S) ferredoxin domain-containing protein [Solobacterium sp.]MCH4281826.1 (2Fe-2S) ferredoxin domain-containing protein [Solobacterium sp.]NLH64435.1 (2Fe-2S) ferredoxin domain-containing protein [Erysipelotrichaceae bacterium]